jgi:hypothetical protein
MKMSNHHVLQRYGCSDACGSGGWFAAVPFFARRLHDWAFFHVDPSPLPIEQVVTHDVAIDESTGQRQGDDITEEELESWVALNADFYDTPVPHHAF